MIEFLALLVGGSVVLAILATGLKILEWTVHLVVGLIVLPLKLLGGLLALVGGLIALPFHLLGWMLGGLGLLFGFVVVPLLPLAFVALAAFAFVACVRALSRPLRSRS